MTSKISFVKLMREDLKRRSWLTALLSVVYFLCYPAAIAIALDSMSDSVAAYTKTEMQSWVLRFFGFGRDMYMGLLLVVVTAVVIGVSEFSYIHSREKLDLYHSLPVRRKKLFMSSYLTGALLFLAVFAASQILCAGVVWTKGLMTAELPAAMGKMFLMRSMAFLFIYHIVIFAMYFTGNTVLAVLGMLVLCMYGPVLVGIADSLVEIGFYTATEIGFGWIAYTSPVSLLITMEACLAGNSPFLTHTALVVAGIIVFFGASLWMCEHRKTECAGMALGFPRLEPVLKFLLVLPGAVSVGLTAYGMSGEHKILWIFGGFLFGTVLLSVLMEFIYHRDMKMILQHKLGLGVTAAVGMLFLFSVLFDLGGYNTYLPQKEAIRAMSVCSENGLPNGNFVSGYIEEEKNRRYYDEALYERMKKTETEAFDVIYRMAELGVEEVKKGRRNTENGSNVTVRFVLKNGKEVYRKYRIPEMELEQAEDALYQEEWYRNLCYPILSEENANLTERMFSIQVNFFDTESEIFAVGGKQAQELLEVYRKELAEKTPQELREDTIGSVSLEGEVREAGKDSYWNIIGYPLNETFTETMKIIKE